MVRMESEVGRKSGGLGSGEKGGAEDPFSSRDTEDNLADLMPVLKRRFRDFLPENDEDREDHGKENVFPGRKQIRRRAGSGRVTTCTALNFDQLGKLADTTPSSRSGSFYHNISSVLKENVNKGEAKYQILEDFYTAEDEKRISAVARRKLERGGKSNPVEDRLTRHRRSRRLSNNRRTSICLNFDAARIAEWDLEELAVETERPGSDVSTFGSAGVPHLFHNSSSPVIYRDGDVNLEKSHPTPSPPDMDISLDDSFPADEQAGRRSLTTFLTRDTSYGRPDFNRDASDNDANPDDFGRRNSAGDTGADSPQAAPGLRKFSGENHMGISNRISRVIHPVVRKSTASRLRGVSPGIKMIGFPESLSPTPPSNPAGIYKSHKYLDKNVNQRKLAFTSLSSSSESSEKVESKEIQNLDFEDIESFRVNCSNDALQDDMDVSYPSHDKEIDLERGKESTSNQERPHTIQSQQGDAEDKENDLERVKESTSKQETPHMIQSQQSDVEAKENDLERLKGSASDQETPHMIQTQRGEAENNNKNSGGLVSRRGLNEDQKTPSGHDDKVSQVKRDLEIEDSDLRHMQQATPSSPSGEPADEELINFGRQAVDLELNTAGGQEADAEVNASGGETADVEFHASEDQTSTASEMEDKLPTRAQLDFHGNSPGECKESNIFEDQRSRSNEEAVALDASQQDEVLECQDALNASRGETKKVHRRKTKQQRNYDKKRFSLAGQGSSWDHGQRRSQRIRVKPLEWWRGERLLYGRVHESLPTLVGIKHSSPTKYARGIRVPFTVDSFVSPRHDKLVKYLGG